MKYINTLKGLLVASVMGVASVSSAQDIIKPISYGPSGAGATSNFYKDYVGVRFQVCSPGLIAGDKVYTVAYNTGSSSWGGAPTNMYCKQVKFATPDTDACSSTAFASGLFTGKIALIWRGTCQFGTKSLKAQSAGADAVVIVNNVDGGPVGMAAGTDGGSVHIPVFMISLNDGTDIINQINAGATVTMTIITNWSTGYGSDLGFVPGGVSISANSAMPWKQINANPSNGAYVMKPGAYIANYGLHTQTNVKLTAALSWLANGSSTPTPIQTDSVVKTTPFLTTDSIYAMFTGKYSLPTTLTGPGRFDLHYNISSDSTDAFTGDNSLTYSFYASDSIYSKGRYDFTNGRPVSTTYTGPAGSTSDPYIWSVPYYVAVGGSYAKATQMSVASGTTGALNSGDQLKVYLFQWTDTAFGHPDSLMENEELQLIGTAVYNTASGDSSFKTYTLGFQDSNGVNAALSLNANTWYVVAAEMPTAYSLGCDGVLNGLPRSFGLLHFNHIAEYYNPIWYSGTRQSYTNSAGNDVGMLSNPYSIYGPWAFPGFITATDVDSVSLHNQSGLIPALPLITSSHSNVAVNEVKSVFSKIELYPNPATNTLNVAIGLETIATQVTYTVIDAVGRTMSHDTHHNVLNDTYTLNTSTLAAGSYYMIVRADDKVSTRKFVVAK